MTRPFILTAATAALLACQPVGEGPPDGVYDGLASVLDSYGECDGPCRFELTFDGDRVTYTSEGWDGRLYDLNTGILTPTAQAEIDTAVASVSPDLPLVTGCPDCDDGGATDITLTDDGATVRFSFEAGAPPPDLAPLDGIARRLFRALQGCDTTDDVINERPCR